MTTDASAQWEAVAQRAARPPAILDVWRAERGPAATGELARRLRAENSWRDLGSIEPAFKGSELYAALVAGGGSDSGIVVTEDSAMRASAVYACVSKIGGAIGSLPMHLYTLTGEKKRRAKRTNLWWLLNESPSPMWTASAFWQYLLQAKLLHGDAFALIVRGTDEKGGRTIKEFLPVHPRDVEVFKHGGARWYGVRDRDTGKAVAVPPADMIHVPGPGFDGERGMSLIRYTLQNSVGIALAADQYSARFFGNGARPDFVLSTEQVMKQPQVDLLRQQWDERHAGTSRAFRPAVLTNGLKVEQLTMNSKDAQLLDARKFQIEDICRVFGVPPFMVGHTEKTTSWGSGVEQMSIGFVKYTLQSHLTAIEQEFNRKCFRTARTFAEFSVEGLLRGDSATRANFYRAALGGSSGPGWMSQNEVRDLENLPPAKNGDELAEWNFGGSNLDPGAGSGDPADNTDGGDAAAADGEQTQ